MSVPSGWRPVPWSRHAAVVRPSTSPARREAERRAAPEESPEARLVKGGTVIFAGFCAGVMGMLVATARADAPVVAPVPACGQWEVAAWSPTALLTARPTAVPAGWEPVGGGVGEVLLRRCAR